MKPRHGAISSTLLTVAGVLGLGAAAASLVTGVTPCSLLSSCDTDKAAAPTAITVADAKAVSSCESAPAPATAALASDCGEAKDCGDKAQAMTVAAKGDCDTAKSDCGDKAQAMTVAAKGDCGAAKSDCGDKAQAMTVAAKGDCDGATSGCGGEAQAMTVAAEGDCGSNKTDCGGNAMTVAAGNAGCGDKADCGGEAQAMTVAAEGDACGGECAEGEAKSLPVAAHAFNGACPYSGNPVKANVVSAHYGMDVHFCCNGCKSRFDKAEVETRAELVRGVVQPINDTCCDKPVDMATTAVVQGFPVAFCKPACGDMVRNADSQKQMNFVASKIKYVNAECCGKPTADAKLVGFHKGKAVAFNGSGCADKFNAMSDRDRDAYVKKVSAGQSESCGDKKCADEGCQNAA